MINKLEIPNIQSEIEALKKEVFGNKKRDETLIDQVSSSQNLVECLNCKSKISSQVKFCPECGNKIELLKPKFCEECGSSMKSGTKFCPNCGKKAI